MMNNKSPFLIGALDAITEGGYSDRLRAGAGVGGSGDRPKVQPHPGLSRNSAFPSIAFVLVCLLAVTLMVQAHRFKMAELTTASRIDELEKQNKLAVDRLAAAKAGTNALNDPAYATSVAGLTERLSLLEAQLKDRDNRISSTLGHVITVHFQERASGGRQKDVHTTVEDLVSGKVLDCGDPAGTPFDNNNHICRSIIVR
jgi:hypothetical protein